MKKRNTLNYLSKSVLLVLIFTLHAAVSFAQDRVIEVRDGKEFFVHQVASGHTLYSLSKLYGVDVASIEKHNKGVENGLSIGQTLYIPVPQSYDEDRWENPIRIENGFMIHRVQRKETLYSISKEYNVDMNDMLGLNPGIELGLKEGGELKIPKQIEIESVALELPESPEDSLETHIVQAGETLYSISKLYGHRVDEIVALNPGAELGLDIGQKLRLPEVREDFMGEAKMDFKLVLPDSVMIKDEYVVSLLLPFYLESLKGDTELDSKSRRLQEIGMSFYRGSMMALDSLKKRGANLKVRVFDVSSDQDVDRLLSNNELVGSDLIIGPLQKSALISVSKFANPRGIHIVCPSISKNNILLASPNLSKVKSSESSHIKTMAKYVAKNHSQDNVILINSMDVSDARKVQLFKKYYGEYTQNKADSAQRSLIEFTASSKFVGDLKGKLSKFRRNVLVVPAGKDSRSMIANLQTKLQLLEAEEYDVVVFGTEDWMSFDFLDTAFKNKIHLCVPTSLYIDYENEQVKALLKNYRNKYHTEPGDYGYLGYDVMLYYGQALLQFGLNFPNEFDRVKQDGLLHIGMDYFKTGIESGFENESTVLLRYNNFKLEMVHGG